VTAEATAVALWRVETTVATQEQARGLARRVVEHRLAACAQIEPIESVYRWHDELVVELEYRIVLKTTAGRYPALEAALHAHHPYELSQIVAIQATAAEAGYANWVDASVRVPPNQVPGPNKK
jgi:periplasmic divalent cation tolerance protein